MKRRYSRQTAFRLPADLVRRLDAHAKLLSLTTGMNVSRSDVVRLLLERALPKPSERERAESGAESE